MLLQNKSKYNLAKLLAKLAWDPNDARLICDDTIDETDPANPRSFNSSSIKFANTTTLELWTDIITEAEKQELLLPLVEVVKNRNNGNKDLLSFCDEIKNGFERRVEKIARAIKKNDCVLFMGPELLQCLNGVNAPEAFSRLFSLELSKKLGNAGVYFDKELSNSISYIANRYEDIPNVVNRELGIEVQKSFAAAKVYKTVFDKIAQLKFPLVISTNPDDILEKQYKNLNIPYQSGFYDRSNQNKNETTFDDSNSIIYKIFGSFENPYSILFTDNDRVQFAKNVVKNDPAIPPVIKVLLENKCCLFLGFNFQEWHLKILIDCLGLAKKEDQTFALLMDKSNESSVEHFEKNYKFYFINEEIEEFLDEVIKTTQSIP
ncbi:MAG: SIR2 family protein [Bacteroidota bacterium]|nr:SIR2 family protein [Bacteroidota bacterium]